MLATVCRSFGLLVLFLIAVLPPVARAAETPKADDAVRIMTFNIRYNNPRDGANAWPRRKDVVAKIISDNQVDIAGLQEALPGQIKDLQKRLPQYAWYGVGRDDGKTKGEFAPIFYRKDRFEVIDKSVFWLSKTPEAVGSKSWDAAITRIATWMKLKDKATGKSLLVVNTHFDHRGQQARIHSAELLRKRIDRLAGNMPVVLLGDFNTTPGSEPFVKLTQAKNDVTPNPPLTDSRDLTSAKPEGPNSTWNGFQAIVPNHRIDFIFIRGNIQVARHRTLDARNEGRFPSDHLPVVIDTVLSK